MNIDDNLSFWYSLKSLCYSEALKSNIIKNLAIGLFNVAKSKFKDLDVLVTQANDKTLTAQYNKLVQDIIADKASYDDIDTFYNIVVNKQKKGSVYDKVKTKY